MSSMRNAAFNMEPYPAHTQHSVAYGAPSPLAHVRDGLYLYEELRAG